MANNNATKGALYPEPGTQLRIPTDINKVFTIYIINLIKLDKCYVYI
jgi:hypothetical protein